MNQFANLVLAAVLLAAHYELAEARVASVRPDGTLTVDGEPFFPVGIYHVSFINQRQGQELVDDLAEIAAAGFNTVLPVLDPEHAEVLDEAELLDLRVIVEIFWPSSMLTIGELRDRPAVIGWSTGDDFNVPPKNTELSPEVLAERKAVVAALDSDAVAYASGGGAPTYDLAPWARAADAFGIQSYQISNCFLFCETPTDEFALRANVRFYDHARTELPDSMRVANLQAFAFAGGRHPTPVESRNMLYGALVTGIKGVIYYTYYDDRGVLPTLSPVLWAELQEQTDELRVLTPFLTDGSYTRVETGRQDLEVATWQYAGRILAVAVNTSRSVGKQVAVDLPLGTRENLRALFATRGATGMSVENGRLVGTVEPEQVHVYLLEAAGSTPCGDATGDGRVSATDALRVLTAATGGGSCKDCACDVDADGRIAASDALRLLRYATGVDMELTCPPCSAP